MSLPRIPRDTAVVRRSHIIFRIAKHLLRPPGRLSCAKRGANRAAVMSGRDVSMDLDPIGSCIGTLSKRKGDGIDRGYDRSRCHRSHPRFLPTSRGRVQRRVVNARSRIRDEGTIHLHRFFFVLDGFQPESKTNDSSRGKTFPRHGSESSVRALFDVRFDAGNEKESSGREISRHHRFKHSHFPLLFFVFEKVPAPVYIVRFFEGSLEHEHEEEKKEESARKEDLFCGILSSFLIFLVLLVPKRRRVERAFFSTRFETVSGARDRRIHSKRENLFRILDRRTSMKGMGRNWDSCGLFTYSLGSKHLLVSRIAGIQWNGPYKEHLSLTRIGSLGSIDPRYDFFKSRVQAMGCVGIGRDFLWIDTTCNIFWMPPLPSRLDRRFHPLAQRPCKRSMYEICFGLVLLRIEGLDFVFQRSTSTT